MDFLLPLTRQLTAATTTTQLESAFEQQTAAAARYLRDNTRWVRMTLFRLLEQPDEVVVEEDQLQREMLDLVDACLVRLRDRGLIRPVDTRALVVMLVTALPAWFLAARARPSHVSLPDSGEGLDRTFRALFTPLLRRLLLP